MVRGVGLFWVNVGHKINGALIAAAALGSTNANVTPLKRSLPWKREGVRRSPHFKEALMHACSGLQWVHLEMKRGKQADR